MIKKVFINIVSFVGWFVLYVFLAFTIQWALPDSIFPKCIHRSIVVEIMTDFVPLVLIILLMRRFKWAKRLDNGGFRFGIVCALGYMFLMLYLWHNMPHYEYCAHELEAVRKYRQPMYGATPRYDYGHFPDPGPEGWNFGVNAIQ